MGTTCTDDIG